MLTNFLKSSGTPDIGDTALRRVRNKKHSWSARLLRAGRVCLQVAENQLSPPQLTFLYRAKAGRHAASHYTVRGQQRLHLQMTSVVTPYCNQEEEEVFYMIQPDKQASHQSARSGRIVLMPLTAIHLQVYAGSGPRQGSAHVRGALRHTSGSALSEVHTAVGPCFWACCSQHC